MSKDNDFMTILPLGGGQEVGRSCILLTYRDRTIMLDCGTHPGREGNDSLPFFDTISDSTKIDLILVTHFHIDHCAGLPYFTEKTNFNGKILMTHATKAVMKLLLSDNIRLQSKSRFLYDEKDLQSCIDKIDVIDFHQTISHRGIKVTATAAGHVLGASMFTIEIDGVKVLYTGDYSMEEDRHLIPGSIPPGDPPDVLIVESTFGVTTLPTREDREAQFTSTVHKVVSNGGSCLIPVFALGRAQELLLILDEFWQAHPELQHVPVYYASRLASKALRVYQTFVNTMSTHIRDSMDVSNPFRFECVQSMTSAEFNAVGPCVVMAAPGFLQTGVSRELFEQWCEDEKNAVIIAGYTVEGTLAHDLLTLPREIVCMDGRIKQRRCLIEHISFSAHVDYTQNSQFIKSITPDNIILVHGEKSGMKRLKDELDREIRKNWPTAHRPPVAMPENGVKVKLQFNKPMEAEIVGDIATQLLTQLDNKMNGQGEDVYLPSSTLLVTEEFFSRVLLPQDLPQYTPCRLGQITHRIMVPIPEGFSAVSIGLDKLRVCIEDVFDDVQVMARVPSPSAETSSTVTKKCLLVQGMVEVFISHENSSNSGSSSGSSGIPSSSSSGCVMVEWTNGPTSDLIADSIIGLITQALSVPSLLKMSLQPSSSSSSNQMRGSASTSHSLIGGRRRRKVTTEPSTEKKAKVDDSIDSSI